MVGSGLEALLALLGLLALHFERDRLEYFIECLQATFYLIIHSR